MLIRIITILVLLANGIAAGGTQEINSKIDKIFSKWDSKDTPGCALAVYRDGKILYSRGYGMADLERGVPLTPQSVFDIGSTSKQFSAMAILLAEKKGKLSVDDDIRKYLPEMPDYGKPVTIRHLIYHTSGLRDYLTLMSLSSMAYENDYPDEEVVAMIARQKELNFVPGDEHLYSNSGYFLLSEIIKRATGKSLRAFADENIFKPLKMNHTHFHDNFREIVPNRAMAYSPAEKGSQFVIDMSLFDVVGDGSLMTNVEDLLKWDENFYSNTLGDSASKLIEEFTTPGTLNSGKKLNYAFGITVDEYRGLKRVIHGGSWAGYRAQLVRFPEQHFSIACLCNLGNTNPTELSLKVADLYLSDQLQKEKAPAPSALAAKGVELSKQELNARTGSFRNVKTGRLWKISAGDQNLVAFVSGYSLALTPESKDVFIPEQGWGFDKLVFQESADKPLSFRTIEEEEEEEGSRFQKVDPPTLTADQMKEYAGDFYCEELDTVYSLRVKDGKLMYRLKSEKDDIMLEPVVRDEFDANGLVFRYQRKDQRISGFTIGAGRVTNIKFVKK